MGHSEPLSREARIFVAGHRGLVGSAIMRRLRREGFSNLLIEARDRLDLRDQTGVENWFKKTRPEYVFLVAGTVGGIMANSTRPAEFLYDNMMIHANVLHASYLYGVQKVLYLGSSCIYPRDSRQPITEETLLTGPLEPTNEAYALAKITGVKLCEYYQQQYGVNFISAMPTNLYGPHDNFDVSGGHVLPSLITRFDLARRSGQSHVTVWGTGTPLREFLHVEDLADACLFLMQHYDDSQLINIGTGKDLSIRQAAEMVRDIVHPTSTIVWDTSKPDGTPRKLLDVSRLAKLGWVAQTDLVDGLRETYKWYLANGPTSVQQVAQ